MTLDIILGIIVFVVITAIVLIHSYTTDNFSDNSFLIILVSLGLGCVVYICTSFIGAKIIQNKYKDDYLNLISENTNYIIDAKIFLDDKDKKLVYSINDNDHIITNDINLDDIELFESDTDKPYITIKKYEGKDHFITHSLDRTVYEYYGNINDLYR